MAASGWLCGDQRADGEGKGVQGKCTVFIVIFTKALTVLAELPDGFPGGMYYIMGIWAIPVLLFAPHIGHQTITVAMETRGVVNLGKVNV